MCGGFYRNQEGRDGENSTSCVFRRNHDFTLKTILLRFPILPALMTDMQKSSINVVKPPVSYERLEEITYEIDGMYGLPATSVMSFLR